MDEFFSPMVRTINRNLVKYSAGQAIFCRCGQVADAKQWVVASRGERTIGMCAPCWDSACAAKPLPADIEVLDGRVLFARAKRGNRQQAGSAA